MKFNKDFLCYVRRIFPKIDKLSALCLVLNLDLIFIMETWLSSDIPNLDIALPNDLSFCCDRNHHGGGIVVYVKFDFITSEANVCPKI